MQHLILLGRPMWRLRLPHRLIVASISSCVVGPLGPGVPTCFAQTTSPNEDARKYPATLDGPLETDRPDFTEGTNAVAAGHVQFELGYTFTYDREGDARLRDHTAPELLVRIGLVDNFELRIGWEGYSWSRERGQTELISGRSVVRERQGQSANDMSLGFKLKLLDQDGWQPDLGIITEISVPTGSTEASSGDVDPELKLLWAYDLSETFSLAGNINVGVPTQDGHRFVQASASLVLGIQLSDTWGSYVEYFGFYPNTDTTDAAHYINGGFTYLVNDNLQLDIRVGFGLNEEADDFFTGVGLSWRL